MSLLKQETPLGGTLFIEWIRKQELAFVEELLDNSLIQTDIFRLWVRTKFNRKFDAEHYSVECKLYTISHVIEDYIELRLLE